MVTDVVSGESVALDHGDLAAVVTVSGDVEERDALLISLTTWPAWRAMWDDPRYEHMLERLKLCNPRS
jgi:hypothetical protein